MPANNVSKFKHITPKNFEKKLKEYMEKCEQSDGVIQPTIRGLLNHVEIWNSQHSHWGGKYAPDKKEYKEILNKYKAKIHEYYAGIVAARDPILYWNRAFLNEYGIKDEDKEIEIRQDENNKPIITIVNKNTRKLD